MVGAECVENRGQMTGDPKLLMFRDIRTSLVHWVVLTEAL